MAPVSTNVQIDDGDSVFARVSLFFFCGCILLSAISLQSVPNGSQSDIEAVEHFTFF